MAKFPDPEWVTVLMEKLNTDEKYAHIARNWEGDILFRVEKDATLQEQVSFYLDLWHGRCREAIVYIDGQAIKSAFVLKAPYGNFVRVLKGELDPMQAMLTRKLGVQGNMAVLMRNVPTVLDFVRCCREITDSFL
jgi:putative sterol carrier protein